MIYSFLGEKKAGKKEKIGENNLKELQGLYRFLPVSWIKIKSILIDTFLHGYRINNSFLFILWRGDGSGEKRK